MADIRGKVERVRDNRVEGWAFAEGGDPVSVALYIDGVRVTKARAKAFRKDLAKAGLGDGNCGFAFVIPPEHMDGRPHKVSVKAGDTPGFLNKAPLIAVLGGLPTGDDDDDVLAKGAHRAEVPEPEPEAEPERDATATSMPAAVSMPKKLRGRLEGLKKNRVVGWIYNTTKPDPVKLAMFVDGVHVASQTARALRADLKAKGINDGLHGFHFELPPAYHDGQTHVAEVRLVTQPDFNLFAPLEVTLHVSVAPADSGVVGPQATPPTLDTQVEFGEGIELIPDADLDFTAEAETETAPTREPEAREPLAVSEAPVVQPGPSRQEVASSLVNLSRPLRNPRPKRR